MTEKENQLTESKSRQLDRRQFLKATTSGAAASAMGLLGASSLSASQDDSPESVEAHVDMPMKISRYYKPFDQINTVFSQAVGGLHKTLSPLGRTFERYEVDNNRPGFTRVDWALHHGAWAIEHTATAGSKFGLPDSGWYGWEQKTKKTRESFLDLNYVYDDPHRFASKKEAAEIIKRAASMYGAHLVGITRQNPQWDYGKLFHALSGREIGWEEFPFKPKTVIVMAIEMDYESIATAPSYTVEGAVGDGYSKMAVVSYQLSVFLKTLGYKSVATGNDLGLSVPYAIQAGLGEGGRNGLLVTYPYGPRVRLCKVYTDLEFVEYDKPMTFGVRSFCEKCQRCADACPSGSIPKNEKPTMAPAHDNPEKWFNNTGVEKWYLDAKSCFEYWCKGNNSCASCITSCPYNKPEFWHHRLVDKLNVLMPGPVHSFMREMDIAFGYGNTFDEKAVKKFWASRGRKYLGY